MVNEYIELEKLGFSVNEARVYSAMLRIGSSLAGKIAKEAALDRSSTYSALKMLQKRGVVSTYFENKRTVYVPEDPKRIIDYFAEKQEVARNVVTKLKQQNSAQNSQTIKLFRGYKGAKSVFQEILDICKRGSTYYVLGSQGQFSEHMQNYAQLFSKLKIEKGIRTKMLRRTHKDKVGKLTDYKIVPSDVDSPATINIYAGKVSIFIWEEVPQVIVIDNPQVARTFENYFKFMWKHARQ